MERKLIQFFFALYRVSFPLLVSGLGMVKSGCVHTPSCSKVAEGEMLRSGWRGGLLVAARQIFTCHTISKNILFKKVNEHG